MSSLSSNQGLQAASLVGRDVVANYNVAPLTEGGDFDGVVELPNSVNGLTVDISDIAGNLVAQVPLGPQPGRHSEFPMGWHQCQR